MKRLTYFVSWKGSQIFMSWELGVCSVLLVMPWVYVKGKKMWISWHSLYLFYSLYCLTTNHIMSVLIHTQFWSIENKISKKMSCWLLCKVLKVLKFPNKRWGRHRYRMVVESTYEISVYHHSGCEFEFCRWWGVLDTTLYDDKVYQRLATGGWFSLYNIIWW
jgi:hypothetical protein